MMKWGIGIFLLSMTLSGCVREVKNPCNLPVATWERVNKIDSLIHDSAFVQRQKEWMKLSYDEPLIISAADEVYRLIMSCSGSKIYTKIVRVEKYSDDIYHAVIKEFDRSAGSSCSKGTVFFFDLPKQDWDSLHSLLNESNFWTSVGACDKVLLHGCTWYIEGYHPIKNKCTELNYYGISGCYPPDSSWVSLFNFFDKLNEN